MWIGLHLVPRMMAFDSNFHPYEPFELILNRIAGVRLRDLFRFVQLDLNLNWYRLLMLG
jgi:hypothetical protein